MEYTRVALDAMGGDNAPNCNITGALRALKENDRLIVYLVGKESVIKDALGDSNVTEGLSYDPDRLIIVDAPDIIENAEPPVMAIRKKKDSSIVKAMNMVKEGQCDAYVSAGSTGAVLVGAFMKEVLDKIPDSLMPDTLIPLLHAIDGVVE